MGLSFRGARSARRTALVTATAVATALPLLPAAAGVTHIDPNTLPRGADPAVAYLVHDTIRDGALRVPAPKAGRHQTLWVVPGGYLVRDYNVGHPHRIRVVHISRTGERRLVASSRDPIDVAISPSGRRMAVLQSTGPGLLRSLITVSVPRTGRVVAEREVRLANLAAVTDHRVLLGIRARWHHPKTVWWSYDRDRVRTYYHQAALRADVRHDRVVFDRTPVGEWCTRVALLSRPGRTLWSSCDLYPHQWSPSGRRVLATHAYFDAAGTDRWWVASGRTAGVRTTITGRLDWTAVWEDEHHFLTMAQGDQGGAAIIRCDLRGSCERASRIWPVPLPDEPSLYYAPPPVVLAER
jgi:hypothetical protein